MAVTLTPHQQDALDWLVVHIQEDTPLVALRGYAGSGKTTLIPALQARLADIGKRVTIGAPTHRAAMILRQKGITNADTVHAHALTPYFTPDYAHAARWLGEEVPCKWEQTPHPDVNELPWLVAEQVGKATDKALTLHRHRGRRTAKKLLASLGIHGKDCFAGFGAKAGEGLLIIDEASMVGSKMLALCQSAFPQVLLIGDPGQLPPVKDEALLASVPGVDLTEIHRQAADSPIIQLAYRARNGDAFWRDTLTACEASGLGGAIVESAGAAAAAFLDAPLIVWRNATRTTCTHAIRQALGYEKGVLMPGEPLVCRTSSQEDRALGFYNNGLYRLVEVSMHDPRLVTVTDALGEEQEITIHLEEVDGENIPYQAIPFRFGYCLTAHTAQGGEWPTVYISRPDLVQYASFCAKSGRLEERAQWTYTAITRAKETLCFLTQHTFTERSPTMPPKSGQTSAPMLTLTPEPDDIPEPVVPAEALEDAHVTLASVHDDASAQAAMPPEVPTMPQDVSQGTHGSLSTPTTPDATYAAHEALLVGFCEALQNKLRTWLVQEASALDRREEHRMMFLKDWVQTIGTANEHASYQLSASLEALGTTGLAVLSPPYQVVVQAMSPQGYPVTMTLTKATASDLIEELGRMLPWMTSEGYGVPVAEAVVR